MEITINGNVIVNHNTDLSTIINKDALSLRQLRSILPCTKDVKTPTRDWVREHMDGEDVFFSSDFANGDRLVVFENGFYCFGNDNWTILRVDGFSRIYYETDEEGGYETLEEDSFMDDSFIPALGMNALWQLKRNAAQRKGNTNETAADSEIIERQADKLIPDIMEFLIERDEKADEHRRLVNSMAKLTDAQREVIIMRYWKNMTIPQIATKIGRSEDSVKDRIRGAIKSLKKNF